MCGPNPPVLTPTVIPAVSTSSFGLAWFLAAASGHTTFIAHLQPADGLGTADLNTVDRNPGVPGRRRLRETAYCLMRGSIEMLATVSARLPGLSAGLRSLLSRDSANMHGPRRCYVEEDVMGYRFIRDYRGRRSTF